MKNFSLHICISNETNPDFLNKQYNTLTWTFAGLVELPLSIIEFLITILFLFSLAGAMRKRRVSRKYYLLIANRSVGDLIVSGIALCNNIAVIIIVNPDRYVIGVFSKRRRIFENIRNIVMVLSIYTCSLTYISLSLMKLFAVTRPFQYIRKFTIRKVIYIIAVIWTITLIMVLSLELTQFCNDKCKLWYNRIFSWVMISLLFATLICFFITGTVIIIRRNDCIVAAVKRAQKASPDLSKRSNVTCNTNISRNEPERHSVTSSIDSGDSDNKVSSKPSIKKPADIPAFSNFSTTSIDGHANDKLTDQQKASVITAASLRQTNRNRWRFSMWKLALNVATFAIFNLNYLAFYLFVEYWSAQACNSGMFRNNNPLLLVRGITFAAQKFRIILDPIITYISDTAIRNSLLEMIRCKRNA